MFTLDILLGMCRTVPNVIVLEPRELVVPVLLLAVLTSLQSWHL